jgi:caffeoyl-CoA O-methyltransferase
VALAVKAAKIVEIGTLAGYSGVCLARALPHGGRLDTFEFEPKHAKVARESFARASVEKMVHVHVGKALENLPSIEKHGPFDLVFIDADKIGYPDYLRWSAANLRRGGVVLADNVFRAAFPPDAGWSPESIDAIDLFNRDLATGGNFLATFLPTVEGLAIGVKI